MSTQETRSIALDGKYGLRFGDGVMEAGPGTERPIVVLEVVQMAADGVTPRGDPHVVTFDSPDRFAEFLDSALASAKLSWPGKFISTVRPQ